MLFYCYGKKVEIDENTILDNYLFKKIHEALLYNKELIPGRNGIPKGLQFIVDDTQYRAYFESDKAQKNSSPFEIIDEKDLNFDVVYANTLFIHFDDDEFKDKYIACKLSKQCLLNNYTFQNKNNMTSINSNEIDYCLIDVAIDNQSNENKLGKYYQYFEILLKKLESKKEETRFELNLDLLKKEYSLFNDIVVDDKSMLLPIKGGFSFIKEVVVEYTTNDEHQEHFNLQIAHIKNEDKTYRKKLLDEKIVIDKQTTIYELCDLDEQEKEKIEWLIKDDKTEKVFIAEDLKGEITRVRRILNAITKINSGNVQNLRLVDTICNNSIDYFDYDFDVKDEILVEIADKYPVFKKNKEQLIAMAKVLDMDKRNIDVMLIQGPPGTGKTELITALIKELSHNGKSILVSSNVHVACDNIIERIKGDKEIVVKRYKNLKETDKFKNEKLVNQQNYIKQQVFDKYQLNGNAVYDLDGLKKLEEIRLEKENLLKETSKKYSALISEENEFSYFIHQLEELDKKINEKKKEIEANQEEKHILQDEIEIINKDLSEINDELIDIREETKKKSKEHTNLSKELNTFKKKANEAEKEISQLEDDISSLQKKIDASKDFIIKIDESVLEIENRIEELESIDIVSLQNEIKNNFINLTLIDTNYKCFEDGVKQINDLISLVAVLNNRNLYLEDIPQKLLSNDFKNCSFLNKIFEDLQILNKYYKSDTTSKILSIFKMKSNGNNISYWEYRNSKRNVIDFINYILNYRSKIFNDIIKKEINKDKIQKLIEKERSNKNRKAFDKEKSEQEISSFKKSISQKEDVLRDKNVIYQNLQSDIENLETKVTNLKLELDELIDDEKDLQADLKDAKNKLLTKNKLLKNNDTSYNALEKDFSKLLENTHSLEKIIDELSNNEEFTKFKNEIDNCNKLRNVLSIEIEQLNNQIEFLNYCHASLTKVNDNTILFDYIKELQDLSKYKTEDLSKYLEGCGNLFDVEFNVGGADKNGSILSMTTNQVAQVYNRDMTFDYAIIDEASKCSLQDLLVCLPIANHLVLIGDYMQLDPIYDEYKDLDDDSKKVFYNCEHFWDELNKSAFSILLIKAIEKNYKNRLSSFYVCRNVAVMKRQYRMNKGIFDLISPVYKIHRGFELIDEKNTKSNDVLCLNISGKEDSVLIGDRPTYKNRYEANYIKETIDYIRENYNKLDIKTIGIITGYSGQVQELNRILNKLTKQDIKIEIGTFDRFQGKEFDLVLVSLVRTEKLGFLNDVRRMNVAFSRAKKHLIIFGNIKDIVKNCMTIKKDSDDLTPAEKERRYVNDNLLPKLLELSAYNDCLSVNEAILKIKKMLEVN